MRNKSNKKSRKAVKKVTNSVVAKESKKSTKLLGKLLIAASLAAFGYAVYDIFVNGACLTNF